MSTKTETKQSSNNAITYDPGSKQAYDQNIATSMPILQQLASNPLSNAFFNQQLGMGNKQATQAGQRGIANILSNAKMGGFAGQGTSPFLQSMLANAHRGTSGLQQGNLWNAMNSANSKQMQSLGLLSSFNPLMTGSNSQGQSSQTTSGLGTWLPQLIGGGLSAAAGVMTGGASTALQGASHAAAGAIGQGASNGGTWLGGQFGSGGGGLGSGTFMPSLSTAYGSGSSLPAFNPLSLQY